MKKFNELVRVYESQIKLDPDLYTEADDNVPPVPPVKGDDNVQPQVPNSAEVKEPTADVTSEGKKFLVELALKALSVNPNNITSTDKEIFNTEVTTDNADEVLKRIQSLVDLYS